MGVLSVAFLLVSRLHFSLWRKLRQGAVFTDPRGREA